MNYMEDLTTPGLRRTSVEGVVIPFPVQSEVSFGLYQVDCRFSKQPSWISRCISVCFFSETVKIRTRNVILKKFKRNVVHLREEKFRKFVKTRKFVEAELFELFDFLDDANLAIKCNLVDKFNQQVFLGEIVTIAQMKTFYKKAQQLAECIQTYLRKEEYCANFMKDISIEVFEKGFSVERESSKLRDFCPNCFCDGESCEGR